MQLASVDQHMHMQQPALFEAVVGHIRMARVQHRPARQQGVAMFAVARDRVGAVDRLVALGREVVGLLQIGPAGEVLFQLAMVAAHLLETDDVGVELLDGVRQVVDLQPARQAQALDALVDVVGRDTQNAHARNDRMAPTRAAAERGGKRSGAGPPQVGSTPSGGSDPRSGGAWGQDPL